MTQQIYSRLLRLPEVLKISGLCRATIYEYMKKGLWPKAVHVGFRSVAWPENEVFSINEARIASKSNDEICLLVATLMRSRNKNI